jgi:hypothetical protein
VKMLRCVAMPSRSFDNRRDTPCKPFLLAPMGPYRAEAMSRVVVR